MRSDIDAVRENLLVLRAQAREEGAFSDLVAQYDRRVLYYIHHLVGDADLADVMQEIWIRVFLKIPTLRSRFFSGMVVQDRARCVRQPAQEKGPP